MSNNARFHTILVPLDGSDTAEHALAFGWRLAVDYGATLHLVSVAEGHPKPIERAVGYTWIGYEDRLKAEKKSLTAYLERLVDDFSAENVPVKMTVLCGEPATAIAKHARDIDCDLIVMATHGRTGAVRWALGSIAERLVRGAERPVLVVR